jgi:hypothetical protein
MVVQVGSAAGNAFALAPTTVTSPLCSAQQGLLAVLGAVVSLVPSAHRTTTAVSNRSLVKLDLVPASGGLEFHDRRLEG